MKKLSTTFFTIIFCSQIFAQNNFATFLQTHFCSTLSDADISRNIGGFGVAVNSIFFKQEKINLIINSGVDVIGGTKQVIVNANGDEIKTIKDAIHLYIGANCNVNKYFFANILCGLTFINSKSYFGLKANTGSYFTSKQKTYFVVNFANIFNRESFVIQNYSTLNFGIGIKLF